MQKTLINLLTYGAAAYVVAKLLAPFVLLKLCGLSYELAIFGFLSTYNPGI